jgi:hypothetical protein
VQAASHFENPRWQHKAPAKYLNLVPNSNKTSNLKDPLAMPPAHPQSRIILAPQPYTPPQGQICVFLAGSIDQGRATTWQTLLGETLSAHPITILNPRRPDWDSSWVMDISDPQFREQVEWELDMLEAADVVALYLAPDSQAPISLLELGLFARTGKVIVGCPEGYWRRGNVQIVCRRFGIELVDSLEDLVEAVQRKVIALGTGGKA